MVDHIPVDDVEAIGELAERAADNEQHFIASILYTLMGAIECGTDVVEMMADVVNNFSTRMLKTCLHELESRGSDNPKL